MTTLQAIAISIVADSISRGYAVTAKRAGKPVSVGATQTEQFCVTGQRKLLSSPREAAERFVALVGADAAYASAQATTH